MTDEANERRRRPDRRKDRVQRAATAAGLPGLVGVLIWIGGEITDNQQRIIEQNRDMLKEVIQIRAWHDLRRGQQ